MILAYLDASALAKRYVPETGSPAVEHLFRRVPTSQLAVLSVGLAEVMSILVRKRNLGRLTAALFRQAVSDASAEVGTASPVRLVTVDGALAQRAFHLIDQYSINSTDAILLRSALDLAAPLRARGDDLLLVASDRRLLKASQAEGLATFDPEAQSPADLDAFLGP